MEKLQNRFRESKVKVFKKRFEKQFKSPPTRIRHPESFLEAVNEKRKLRPLYFIPK